MLRCNIYRWRHYKQGQGRGKFPPGHDLVVRDAAGKDRQQDDAMRVLAIQSQVIYGHVGNSAGAFALQRQGVETWAVPTAVLAFNPSYGPPAMRATEPSEMDSWMMALQTRPEWQQIDAILLGWLGNPRTAEAAARAALAARAANPDAVFLCDPVMGDSDCGLYVDKALPPFIREQLIPKADIVTPNGFELEYLLGDKVEDLPSALAACDKLRAQGPKTVIATTLKRRDGGAGTLDLGLELGDVFVQLFHRIGRQILGLRRLLARIEVFEVHFFRSPARLVSLDGLL